MNRLNKNCISIPFHWDVSVLAITILTLILLVGTCFYLDYRGWPPVMIWLRYVLMIVFFSTIIGGVGYMPIRLVVDDKKVILKRLFGSLEILRSEIIEVKRIPRTSVSNSIRTFGSGGFFGYLGRFRSPRLGHYTMYATELDNLIFIRTRDKKKYVFSCSRCKELIELLSAG